MARFTVAYWCVLVAALLPIVCAWIAKSGTWANRPLRVAMTTTTRAAGARQGDWRARITPPQANSFESLPFFIGAVIIAHQLGARQTWLDLLALCCSSCCACSTS